MFDYSYITLYNLVFTSLPCIFAGQSRQIEQKWSVANLQGLFLGVLDQDLTSGYSFKYPQLYMMGIRNDKFKRSRFYWTVLDAVYQSAICFGVPYLIFIGGNMSSSGYDTKGVFELGTFIAGIAVVVANALVGFTIFSWTWLMVIVIMLSSATFFVWTEIYAHIMTFTFYGEDILFREGAFWLCLVITFVICMLPRFVTKYCLHMYWPFDNDIIRELVLCKPRRGLLRRYGGAETDEEAIPITLARAQSEQTVATENTIPMQMSDTDVAEERARASRGLPLLRRLTDGSRKSEIMYMHSGKRTSLKGFAFSSDEASVFDEFRKSVYRQSREHDDLQRSSFFRNSTMHNPKRSSRNPIDEDWMLPLGFRLKRYDTAPETPSPTKNTGLGWKMMTAMKQHMSTSRSPSNQRLTASSDFVELSQSDPADSTAAEIATAAVNTDTGVTPFNPS